MLKEVCIGEGVFNESESGPDRTCAIQKLPDCEQVSKSSCLNTDDCSKTMDVLILSQENHLKVLLQTDHCRGVKKIVDTKKISDTASKESDDLSKNTDSHLPKYACQEDISLNDIHSSVAKLPISQHLVNPYSTKNEASPYNLDGQKVSGILNDSSAIDLDRAVCKLSICQKLSEPFASENNYCTVRNTGEHILLGDTLVSAFESVHVDEPFGQNQDKRSDSNNAGCDLEATRLEISVSSPQRSSVTRRRRSSAKRARAAVWRSFSNVLQNFEENSNININLIEHEKPIRSQRSQTTGRQGKNQSLNALKKSPRKIRNMTGGISVDIKLGIVGGLASVMDAVNDIEGLSETVEKLSDHSREEEFAGSNASHDCKENLLEMVNASDYTIHTIHKNLDENKASSVTDSGTSPDSEVINLNVDICSAGNGQEELHDIQNSSGSVSFVKPIHNIKNRKNNILHSGGSSPEDELLNFGTMDSGQQFMDVGHLNKPFDISDKVCSRSQGGKVPRCTQMEGVRNRKAEISAIANMKGYGSRKKVPGKQKPKPELNIDLTSSKTSSYTETEEPKLSIPGVSGSGNSSLIEDVTTFNDGLRGPAEKSPKPRNAWVLCDNCQKWRRISATLADQIEETKSTWTCLDNMDKAFSDCSIAQEKSNAEINAELDISDVSCDEGVCDAVINSNNLVKNHKSRAPQELTWTRIKSNHYMFRKRKTQTIDEVMVCHCNPPSDGRRGCGDGCLNRMLNIECVQRACPCGEFCSNKQFQKRKYARVKMFRCGKKGYGLQVLDNITEGQFLIEYVGEVLDMHAYEARQKDYAQHGHKHFYFMTLNGSEVIDACAKGNLGRFINHSCDPNCRTEKWMVNGEVCIGIFALRNIKKGEELTFDYNYVRVSGAAAKKCVCGSSQCRGYIGGDPQNAEIIVQDDSDDEYLEPVMISEGDVIDESNNCMTSTIINFGSVTIAEKEPLKDEAGIIMEPLDYDIGDQPDGTQAPLEVIGNRIRSVVQHANIIEECNDFLNTSTALQVDISSETVALTDPLGTFTSPDAVLKPDDPSELLTISDSNTKKRMIFSFDEKNTGTVLSKVLPDVRASKRKAKADTGEGRVKPAKSHTVVKSSRSSVPVKKEKCKVSPVNVRSARQTQTKYVISGKSRKVFEVSSTSRFEAVPEKLNDLLNPDGGISKHKDASRGYLKLLLLTAASGDSYNGEAIQSNRDLSMILDALLKTKSRMVLADIMNKNGLQMLHNMLKRSRKEFNKIPILRKLLKVFEYLATRVILTSEHINSRPTCLGVESFRESILSLTEHVDKQVHQIARNFRDKWIPRPGRRHNIVNWEDSRMDFHRELDHGRFSAQKKRSDEPGTNSEKPDCITKAVVRSSTFDVDTVVGSCQPCSSGTKTRKRKSRWDQPGDLSLHVDNRLAKDSTNTCEDDRPPGFASRNLPVALQSEGHLYSCNPNQVFELRQSVDVVVGQPQQRFISRLPVSYGVPSSLILQIGTPGWSVSPGMPFHPFPPLPPYSRDGRYSPSNIVGSAAKYH